MEESASMLIQNMDQTVDPCDDFYKFACGGFEQMDIPNDEIMVSQGTLLEDKLRAQVVNDR